MRKGGFTLIELIMVIVILGVLAAIALPKFSDLTTKAEVAGEAGVFGGIKAALAVYYADAISNGATGTDRWPVDLEDVDGSVTVEATDNLFTGILINPVSKISDNWNEDGVNSYIGPTGSGYTYTNTTGAFTKD